MEKNFRDGKHWTFNSLRAFNELFPYMTPKSISRWLLELEDGKWIVTGNFNRRRNDNTKWYSIGNKLQEFCESTGINTGYTKISTSQNEKLDLDEGLFASQNEEGTSQNEKSVAQNEKSTSQNEQALPDVSTDIKQDAAAVVLNGSGVLKFLEEVKKVNLMDGEKIDIFLRELFDLAGIPNSALSTERIKKELVDISSEISKQDAWEIIVESFVEVSGVREKSKNSNYLIAKIQGKKNDLYASKNKQKYLDSMKKDKIDEKHDSKKWLELANKEFEKKKKLLTPEAVENIEKLLREKKYLSVMVELVRLRPNGVETMS